MLLVLQLPAALRAPTLIGRALTWRFVAFWRGVLQYKTTI
jgi:hypothetical protein